MTAQESRWRGFAAPAGAAARRGAPRTIALIGAECTGKTTLAQALSAELPGLWLPEALREFCDREGRTPRPDEQAALMREQIEREAAALERAGREGVPWVICDSTPLVTALYSVMLFGDHSLLGTGIEHQRRHALTLLADTDLPWAPDGIQRDGPAARTGFQRLLKATLREARHRAYRGGRRRDRPTRCGAPGSARWPIISATLGVPQICGVHESAAVRHAGRVRKTLGT